MFIDLSPVQKDYSGAIMLTLLSSFFLEVFLSFLGVLMFTCIEENESSYLVLKELGSKLECFWQFYLLLLWSMAKS